MAGQEVKYTVTLRDLISAALKRVQGEAKKTDATMSDLNKTVKTLGNAFGIGIGVAGVVRFGNAVLESLKNYEYFSSGLRTLMKGDAQTAKALEAQLISLAKETPFSLVEVQDATKQLLAYGFSAGSVTQNIRMLGDVASGLKIPFSDIAYLYGTLKTQGRAYTKDIMQFTSRGIPVIKELAKQFNVTEDAVMKLVEDGKVGFKEIERAFQSMTGQGGMFFKMMDEQSKTTGGRISMLGDSFEQLKVNIGKSQTGIINLTVEFLDKMTSAIGKSLSMGNYMNEAFKKQGAEQYGTFRELIHNLSASLGLQKVFGGGEMAQTLGYVAQVQSDIDTANKSLVDAYKAEAKLNKMLADISQEHYFGITENPAEYLKRRAVLKQGIADIKGIIKLQKEAGKVTAPELTPEQQAAQNLAAQTKAEAPKYTQIHINIQEMKAAEDINIVSTKNEDWRQVSDKIMEMMTGALNDSQRMAVH